MIYPDSDTSVGFADDGYPARVGIVMATYNPNWSNFERQMSSLINQTHRSWTCLIYDDGSSPENYKHISRIASLDPRFILRPASSNVGIYRNFERALAGAIESGFTHIFLCDQDDYWEPSKIKRMLAAMDGQDKPALAYHDARVENAQGQILEASFSSGLTRDRDNLARALTANFAAGWTICARSHTVEFALPFPPAGHTASHDHWLTVCAAAIGHIAFVSEALGAYVQHQGNVIGATRKDAWFWARHFGALGLGPLLPGLARLKMLPAVSSRVSALRFLMNDEYDTRRSFTLAVGARLGTSLPYYPQKRRLAWLLKELLSPQMRGGNCIPVLMRLTAGELCLSPPTRQQTPVGKR